MNYLIYPTKTVRITQNHLAGNHNAHATGDPADYPFDEAGTDGGRDYFFCPCDEMKITRIYGVGQSGVNTVWMKSTRPVVMPVGAGYVTIMVEHPEDDDLKKISVGQTFRRGDKMFREGGNGVSGAGTYGNHLHISVGLGDIVGNGWGENSRGAWVLRVMGKCLKADEAFYLDGQTVIKNAGYTFKNLPKEEKKMDNTPDSYAKEAIAWAKKNGILVGGTDGDLKLHTPVTRQDMLVFLHRLSKK